MMSSRHLAAAVLLATSLIVPRAAAAQVPWTVTITPTLNPLPIGLCGAVRIQLADARGNVQPRNPAGLLMGLADFDMSVTAADPAAVVGQQIDASHWSVCACQAGAAGDVATITASYPARHLLPQARAPGVKFQTTQTVTLAAAKGGVNPPGCAATTPVTIAAGGVSGAPATLPSGGTAPTNAGAQARGGVVNQPLTAAPAGTVSALSSVAAPVTVAPAPLTVVARTEWPLPFQGAILLSPGQCQIVYGNYANASILVTDAVILTGQLISQGEQLKWTAAVDSGVVVIHVCNSQKAVTGALGAMSLNGRKVNILVLR